MFSLFGGSFAADTNYIYIYINIYMEESTLIRAIIIVNNDVAIAYKQPRPSSSEYSICILQAYSKDCLVDLEKSKANVVRKVALAVPKRVCVCVFVCFRNSCVNGCAKRKL